MKVVSREKATLEEELTKIKAENLELKNQLQENQEDLQTVQRNYATMSGTVMGLEKWVKAAEDKHRGSVENEVASRKTVILETK